MGKQRNRAQKGDHIFTILYPVQTHLYLVIKLSYTLK